MSCIGGHERKKKVEKKFDEGYSKEERSVKKFKNQKGMNLFTLVFVRVESGRRVCLAESEEDDGMKRGNDEQ